MNLSPLLLSIAILALFLPAVGSLQVSASQGPEPSSLQSGDVDPQRLTATPLRVAYYFPPDPASFVSLRTNVSRLDVVAPHWLVIDEDGQVHSSEPPEAASFLRSAGATVLPSVALRNREAGHRIVTEPAVAAFATEQLLVAVATWHGLALDFEGLDPGDRQATSAFINTLGDAVRAAGKLFLVALPAKTSDVRTGWSGAYEYAAIAKAADLYLVMAYGYTSSASATPGSTAPLPWVDASLAFAAAQIPRDRLLLGVAFYGYDWNLTRGPPARALRFNDTLEVVGRTGAIPAFDAPIGSATFQYESSGEAHEVWYEDARALAARLELVAQYGLRGVGAWRLGQEDPAAWEVWDAYLGPPREGGGVSPAQPATPAAALGTIARASGWLATLGGGPDAHMFLSLENPNPAAAAVSLTLVTDDGSRVYLDRTIPPGGSVQIEVATADGTPDVAVGVSGLLPIVVRGHSRLADGASFTLQPSEPSPRWIFPDGQSSEGIQTRFVVFNPGATEAVTTVVARGGSGLPIWQERLAIPPGTRRQLAVPQAPGRHDLFWTEIVADVPIVAARLTRFPGAVQASAGSPSTAAHWVVPGAIAGGSWLSYVVIANPNDSVADVTIQWSADGRETVDQQLQVAAMGRIGVEAPASLAEAPGSAAVAAGFPIVVERAAYNLGGFGTVADIGLPRAAI